MDNLFNLSAMSDDEQLKLAQHSDVAVRHWFAGKLKIIADAQMILVYDEDHRVRAMLANNPSVISKAQIILAKDESTVVRALIASNPSIVLEAQHILRNDPEQIIRLRLMENKLSIYYEGDKQEIDPSTTTDKDQQLQIACGTYSTFDNTFDRICLASNLSITDEAKAMLFNDPEESVIERLAENTSLNRDDQIILYDECRFYAVDGLAGNPSVVKEIQILIAQHAYDDGEKQILACNPSLCDEARAILEADPSPLIKFALVKGYPVWDDPDWFKLGKRITDKL